MRALYLRASGASVDNLRFCDVETFGLDLSYTLRFFSLCILARLRASKLDGTGGTGGGGRRVTSSLFPPVTIVDVLASEEESGREGLCGAVCAGGVTQVLIVDLRRGGSNAFPIAASDQP